MHLKFSEDISKCLFLNFILYLKHLESKILNFDAITNPLKINIKAEKENLNMRFLVQKTEVNYSDILFTLIIFIIFIFYL